MALGSSIVLRAKIDKAKPATVLINEGSRKHSFVLVFKKNLSVSELVHQWPDTSTLANYVALLDAKKTSALPADTIRKKTPSPLQKKMDSLAVIRKTNEKYDSIVSKAAASFAIQDLTSAKDYATEAHSIKPSEALPVTMIANIESAIRNAARRQKYNDSMQLVIRTREAVEKADKQILQKNWNNALALYKEVLALQPTPAQADYARKKIEAINLEFDRLDTRDKSQISEVRADINIAEKRDSARPEINTAVAEHGDKKRAEQENLANRKLQISNWMDKAQQAFADKSWDSAKAFYKHAIELYPSRERELFARQRIEEINLKQENGTNETANMQKQNTSGAADSAASTDADSTSITVVAGSLKIAEANKLSLQVDELMNNAQKAIMAKKWDSAKAYYLQVVALSPSDTREEFAKKKIDVIELEIAKTAPARTVVKETPAVQPMNTAKIPLQNPANTNVLSGETAKKNTVADAGEKTENELAAIQKEQDRIFQRKLQISKWMDKGQQASAVKQWDSAKAFYRNAIALYPSREREAFAKKKIEEIDAEIKNTGLHADTVANNKKNLQPAILAKAVNEEAAKAILQNHPQNNNADTAMQKPATALKPKSEATETKVNEPAKITAAEAKPVVTLPGKSNGAETKQDTVAGNITGTSTQSKKVSKAIPDTVENNKNILPAQKNTSTKSGDSKVISAVEQHVAGRSEVAKADTATVKNEKEYHEVSGAVLAQKPRIYFTDSSNSVQLICQDISFKSGDAYIKLLVQNKGTSHFSSDSLQVTYIKNYGILKKLKPLYLSGVPDILPGKEAQIVYAVAAIPDVEANEIFILEVEDKLKKSKLTIHLPGDVYNRLKAY